ncbi:dimethylsulfonioproprionate lyase family protein [Limnochorda pilosa]|uniref:Cupin n=1 Tax=Limnochorda pilosa TaxID=1555112 RepID=A0A0K2SM94_LIMPI|nr:dimethylsulfonioproprionate lyase family protein [Limnochorda pilosa]BAS28238.1 cupin [Limnochorda pilosa]
MHLVRLQEIPGEEFPAGRRTRVLVGPNGPLEAEHFVEGYVSIHPGGKVPLHDHEQEEVYLVLSGRGEIQVGDEVEPVEGVTAIYLPPGKPHELRNTGEAEMVMVFVYAPKGVVSHWAQEREGEL